MVSKIRQVLAETTHPTKAELIDALQEFVERFTDTGETLEHPERLPHVDLDRLCNAIRTLAAYVTERL
jgi:hypothetical protein